MDIIMSIHPKWAEKIYAGEKMIEWRKNIPQIYFPGMKIYIYETAPVCKVTGLFYWKGNKNLIIRDPDYEGQEICEEAKIAIKQGCVPLEDLKKYQGKNEKVFGWLCGLNEKFEKPRPLSDFGLKRPPQSWQYLKEEN